MRSLWRESGGNVAVFVGVVFALVLGISWLSGSAPERMREANAEMEAYTKKHGCAKVEVPTASYDAQTRAFRDEGAGTYYKCAEHLFSRHAVWLLMSKKKTPGHASISVASPRGCVTAPVFFQPWGIMADAVLVTCGDVSRVVY